MSTASPLTKDELDSLIALLPFATEQELQEIQELLSTTDSADLSSMPMKPHPRQADFLKLTCEEALYGGAAGSGKSEALLMWLAEGIHLPTYSAIIFRRTFKQLYKSNDSLVAKSHRLFLPLGGVWNGSNFQWRFPSGAMIEFGGLDHLNSIYNYQGPSFHRIAFDELTQFLEDQYLYLFSRIRAVVGFPLGMGVRASANPGGEGHLWVKERFITDDAMNLLTGLETEQRTPDGLVCWKTPDRAFVPARLADNPSIQFAEYVKKLSHLNPVERERLLNGDWRILESGLIRQAWMRYFTMRGEILELRDDQGKTVAACDQRECTRFITIDPAGTSEDRSREARGRAHSWSVAGVWDQLPPNFGLTLVLRDVWRERVDFPGLLRGVRTLKERWNPSMIHIENEKLGEATVSMLRGEMPIRTIATGGKDKVTRAAAFLNMLSKGQVFLPSGLCEWRNALEAEWLSWRGLDTDVADQVDIGSYAGILAKSRESSTVALDFDAFGGTEQFAHGAGW